MSFVEVESAEGFWPGELKAARAADVPILLVNVAGEIRAYEDRCAHQGVALSKGRLEGTALTCSAHGWCYDVASGLGINPRAAQLRRLPVRVENQRIFVDVAPARPAALREPSDGVGPVLHAGPVTDAIVAAIRESHPETQVIDRGAYLRVLVPRRCAVTRSAIERHRGEPFRLPGDLEQVMSSFKGQLTLTEESATWTLAEPRR